MAILEISKKAALAEFSPMRKFYNASVDAKARGIKIHHLNIGQPDIATPKEYFEAIRNFDSKNDYYAPSQGTVGLLEAICSYYSSIKVNINKEDILITTGGSEAILIAAFTILNENDEVLIPEPFYPNYNTIIKTVGGKVRPIPTLPEENYRYADKKKIEKLINKKTRAILVTNPNNPTGTILHDKDMLTLLNLCKEHNLYLICDEVYREICFENERKSASALQFRDYNKNVIVIDSLSKRFSACGARVGAIISRNQDIIQNGLKFAQARLSVSTLNQIGAEALFRNMSQIYTDSLKDEYKKRRDAAVDELKKIKGVRMSVPLGAFYIMATLPVSDTEMFQEWLLTSFDYEGESVMYAPGKAFYESEDKGQNEIRIACVLESDALRRAIKVLGKGIETYNKAYG